MTATWKIQLLVECPWCKTELDLADSHELYKDNPGIKAGESYQGIQATCYACSKQFTMDIEYDA